MNVASRYEKYRAEKGKKRKMKKDKTLRENIIWLLTRYELEKGLEERKENPNYEIIEMYNNYIMELKFALDFSK